MKLSDLRKSRNISQRELALKIGITRTTLSYYENGESYAKFDIADKIAAFFGVPLEEIDEFQKYKRQSPYPEKK